jgi:hypothetical protein
MSTQRLKLNRSDERGVVIVLVAVWLPVLALFAMFAIDVAHWYDYSRNLQSRADAAALAAGEQYGNTCLANPPNTAALNKIGEEAQLYSGPGAASDLPYNYSGLGSPLSDIPGSTYENVPGLKAGTLDQYHLLLNATDYWTGATPTTKGNPAQSFTMGTFCSATDENGRTGAMADVRLTQASLPLFIPLLGIQPNIRAHARVEIQRLLQANSIRPLAVRDPSATPCVNVNFVQTNGNDPGTAATQSVTLHAEPADPNNPGGPIIWDNGGGSSVKIPNGANLYMQASLNNCNGNGATYEANSGILYLNSYGDVPTPPNDTVGYLDPNVDGASSAPPWAKVPPGATSFFSLLDDGAPPAAGNNVRQPTAPSIVSDQITSTSTDPVAPRQDLGFPNTLTWKPGDTYTLWAYGTTSGAKHGVTYAISTNDGGTFNGSKTLIAPTSANNWYQADISNVVTSQATLNGLQVRLTNEMIGGGNGATGTSTIDEVYIQRTPAPPPAVAPAIVGSATTGDGVTLLNNLQCAPDQYFSTGGAGCGVRVCAIVAFTPGATNPHLTVNGTPMTTPSADPTNCKTSLPGATAWTSPFLPVNLLSGQQQFTLAWQEDYAPGGLPGCNGAGNNCHASFGVEQQAYGACNGNAGANTCADPDDSGPIVLAQVGEGLAGTIGSFKGGTTHNLLIKVEVQGLNADKPGDGKPPEVLRFATNSDHQTGLIDCGQGNGASADDTAITNGCPVVGDPNCKVAELCAPLMINQRAGVCDPANRTINPANAADCVTTTGGNRRTKIPGAIADIVVTGGNCSPNYWNAPGGPPANDPRKLIFIITAPADLSGQNGPVTIPIRNFATFYVTGWDTHVNPKCNNVVPAGQPGNDPFPGPGGNADNGAIWGHWMNNVDPDGGGTGTLCDFNSFGDCVAVLSR